MSSPQGIFQALAKHHSPELSVWLCRKGPSWVDCLPNKQHFVVENGCSIFRWGPAMTIYFGVWTVYLEGWIRSSFTWHLKLNSAFCPFNGFVWPPGDSAIYFWVVSQQQKWDVHRPDTWTKPLLCFLSLRRISRGNSAFLPWVHILTPSMCGAWWSCCFVII